MDEPFETDLPGRVARTQPPADPVHEPRDLVDAAASADSLFAAESSDSDCSLSDIESAYRRALEVLDSVDWPQTTNAIEPAGSSNTAMSLTAPLSAAPSAISVAPDSTTTSDPIQHAADASSTDPRPAVSAAQIVEAVMFVGGHPVTAKRLCSLLGGHQEVSDLERLIDELNALFTSQNRPYEIRLGEGGYRLDLLPEFESVRSRVYGLGPRDVKLSQEVLEVLSLVAYKQPISRTELEGFADEGAANILRQLLRRDLIAIQRDETSHDVKYVTTDRFLSVFGLPHLDDLPRPEELDVK